MVHDCTFLAFYWITVVRKLLIINSVYLNMTRMLAPIFLLQYTMTLDKFLLDRCQGKSYMNTLHILHQQNYNCMTWFVVSSIWVRTNAYLRRSDEELPEIMWPEVTSVTWPEVAMTESGPDRKSRDRKRPYRKYVVRMHNRKWRPSRAPEVTPVTWPEVAMTGSHVT